MRRGVLSAWGVATAGLLLASAMVWAEEAGEPPAISHIVQSVEQGGTMTIFGEGLTDDVRVWLWQPRRERAERLRESAQSLPAQAPRPPQPPDDAEQAELLSGAGADRVLMARQAGGNQPAGDDDIATTLVWIENEQGHSEPYRVNAPQLWFASEQAAVPGEQVRLFGVNLYGGDRTRIAMKHEQTGDIHWGEPLRRYNQQRPNVRQHEISFRVPRDIPTGGYTLWVHTDGGLHGWSDGLELEVIQRRDFIAQMGRADQSSNATSTQEHLPEPPRVFRVTEAAGDGVTDDHDAIDSVLREAAEAGGGIVVLPAGVFAVTQTLEIPTGVVVQGAGREGTSITVSQFAPIAAGQSDKARAALVRMRSRTGLQDLGVIAGPGVDINVLVEDTDVAEDVFLRRVRIENTHAFVWDRDATDWENPDFGIYVHSSTRGFRLLHSDLTAPQVFRMEGYGRRHRYAQIIGNRFEAYPQNEEDNVVMLTLSESIFESNELRYGSRAFTSQRGMWRNYVAANQVVNVGGVGNGSEIFLSEYGRVIYSDGVAAADEATLRLPDDADADAEAVEELASHRAEHELYAFVAAGRGKGQVRRVIDEEDRVLTIDRPWRVPPDQSSELMLLGASVNNLFINNGNRGGRGVYTFTYGSGIENVMAGNEATGGGVTSIWVSAVSHEGEPALLAHNTFVNNRLVRNGNINIAALDWSRPAQGEPRVMGNRIIRNQVWKPGEFGSPNQYYAFWNWLGGANAGHGWVEPGRRKGVAIWNGSYNVVENNYIDDAEVGLYAGEGRGVGQSNALLRGNLFRWNRIDRTETPVEDNGEAGHVQPPDYQSY